MPLLDAILEVNRRRLAGDREARVDLDAHRAALPVAALSCIDARLNRLLPDMLGLPDEQFIWLRNAGNILTGPLSSTMRSLALACAVKGAREILIIGHSDCQVCKTTMLQLLERFGALGVDRHKLPENLVEYFGLFSSERQNVLRGTELTRLSPLIGAKVPVHGLVIDIQTGILDQVVDGYSSLGQPLPANAVGQWLGTADRALHQLEQIGNAAATELKLPTGRIGEIAATADQWLHKAEQVVSAVSAKSGPAATAPSPAGATPAPVAPPPLPNPLTTLQDRMRRFSASKGQRPGDRRS